MSKTISVFSKIMLLVLLSITLTACDSSSGGGGGGGKDHAALEVSGDIYNPGTHSSEK